MRKESQLVRVAYSKLLLIAFLSGCAVTSNVQNLGDGNYFVFVEAAVARGGENAAAILANRKAREYCAEENLGFELVKLSMPPPEVRPSMGGRAEVTFTCKELL